MNDSLSRRSILETAVKASGAVLALGAVSQLGACSTSAQKMVDKKGGSLGQPVPSDPIVLSNKPAPVRTPTHKPIITAPSNLSAIPSFVVARTKWTSAKPKRWLADPMNKVTRITVHHDAIMPRPSGSYADSVRRMNLIRKGHLNNGWADIGYHFAIDPNGRIWQARPLELQGAHVKNNNPGNLGIVVFGNYELIRPTQASLNAIDKMVAYAMGRFGVPLSRVYTHQELRSTACPGKNLQAQMLRTRATGGKLALAASQQMNHS
ncbi:MAG: peptidoglycan recognition protein family protein [Phycisphaerales bacterium]